MLKRIGKGTVQLNRKILRIIFTFLSAKIGKTFLYAISQQKEPELMFKSFHGSTKITSRAVHLALVVLDNLMLIVLRRLVLFRPSPLKVEKRGFMRKLTIFSRKKKHHDIESKNKQTFTTSTRKTKQTNHHDI